MDPPAEFSAGNFRLHMIGQLSGVTPFRLMRFRCGCIILLLEEAVEEEGKYSLNIYINKVISVEMISRIVVISAQIYRIFTCNEKYTKLKN
jgi:hypothetical protein